MVILLWRSEETANYYTRSLDRFPIQIEMAVHRKEQQLHLCVQGRMYPHITAFYKTDSMTARQRIFYWLSCAEQTLKHEKTKEHHSKVDNWTTNLSVLTTKDI